MMDRRWLNLAFDTWLLGCDAAVVIWLRLGKIALLDAPAMAEARLMVDEKLEAAWSLQWQAVSGRLGTSQPAAAGKALAHYRRAVAANRRRLSAPRQIRR